MVERRVSRFMREPATVRSAVSVIVSGTLLVVLASALLIRVVDRAEFHGFGDGVWWAVQTVTTVGYGDITPKDAWGRLVAAAVMLWGIALIAILTAAITSTFVARAAREHELEEEQRAEEGVGARFDDLAARLDRIERLLSGDGQRPT
jgi:voltage-gated potassium channel Kch